MSAKRIRAGLYKYQGLWIERIDLGSEHPGYGPVRWDVRDDAGNLIFDPFVTLRDAKDAIDTAAQLGDAGIG